jgi:ABC-type sugar transport system permease subunit
MAGLRHVPVHLAQSAVVRRLRARPVAFAFTMSFTNWQGINPGAWVGLRNYLNLLDDPVFTSFRSIN